MGSYYDLFDIFKVLYYIFGMDVVGIGVFFDVVVIVVLVVVGKGIEDFINGNIVVL